MSLPWVLYALIRKKFENGQVRFLLAPTRQRDNGLCFPPTKVRPGETLYQALVRPLEHDLGLLPESYFVEEELPLFMNDERSPAYPGLTGRWQLFPLDISLNETGWKTLERLPAGAEWLTLSEILSRFNEPNLRIIAQHLLKERPDLFNTFYTKPTLAALTSRWADANPGGVRVMRRDWVQNVVQEGEKALGLRVATPHQPYQKQGSGFSWSFFTDKDPQTIHAHSQPEVEVYGVMAGRLRLWYKPMNHPGVRIWQSVILQAGDWIEIEPLYCHFTYWLEEGGYGTLIKATSSSELSGTGTPEASAKTTCKDCHQSQCVTRCVLPPGLRELAEKLAVEYEKRDRKGIEALIQKIESQNQT